MKTISALIKRDFATIRQLESRGYRLLRPLAVVFGLGIVLCFTTLLMAMGVALIVLSGLGMAGLFLWLIQLQKRPRRQIRCPYCNNPNDVFWDIDTFECDICDRPINFDANGVPIPADGSLDKAQPTSVWDQTS